jgi:flagellar motor switch protein FliG
MPDLDFSNLTPVQSAAVVLISLGESFAAEVLKHLDAKEVQRLGMVMASIGTITREQQEGVVEQFVGEMETQTSVGIGSDEYVRKVLMAALGEDKATGVIDRILSGRSNRGLENLKWMEPKAISELIRNEHPQIIAIVLSYIEPDQSAAVLRTLQDKVRSDVLLRIATLDGIPATALDELNEILERQFEGAQSQRSGGVGGVKVAANILNFVDTSLEQSILEAISGVDHNLSTQIQDLMFVFEDLLDLEDKAIQSVLREVATDRLSLALRGADPKVKDKITRNMSKRAADMLLEDIDARGPAKLSDVEAAQKEILSIVRKLADSGDIQLGGKGDDLV